MGKVEREFADSDAIPIGYLSSRTASRLTVAGYNTVGEVRLAPDDVLMRIPGFGMKSLHEVRRRFAFVPTQPEAASDDRRDRVALEAFRVIIATGYQNADQAARDAYALADAMEAARVAAKGNQ